MKYKLIEGAVYYPFGLNCQPLTSEMLTDEIAEFLLAKDPELLGTVIEKKKKKNKIKWQ